MCNVCLTMAAVLAPKAQRAVTGEGFPADSACASILAGVRLTEGKLSTAAYQSQAKQNDLLKLHHTVLKKSPTGTLLCQIII